MPGPTRLSCDPPPYIVDGPAGLPQVLQNIRFARGVPNADVVSAVSPIFSGLINYPGGGSYFGAATPTGTRNGTTLAADASSYPNPVLNQLTYSLPASVRAHRVTVFDSAGRTVLSSTVEKAGSAAPTLDVSALKSGSYRVRLSAPGFRREFAIIKQ